MFTQTVQFPGIIPEGIVKVIVVTAPLLAVESISIAIIVESSVLVNSIAFEVSVPSCVPVITPICPPVII